MYNTLFEVAGLIPQALGTSSSSIAGNAADLINATRADSLPEFSRSARISPYAIVDGALVNSDITANVLRLTSQLTAVYYLQALSMMMQHNGVAISSILDSLNPNRDLADNAARAAGRLFGGNESYDEGWGGLTLPEYGTGGTTTGNNKYTSRHLKHLSAGNEDDGDSTEEYTGATLHKDTVSNLNAMTNLGIGVVVDAVFESKNGKVSVPIQINPQAVTTDSQSLIEIVSHAEQDISFKERVWKWNSGIITTGQFLTGSDVLDQRALTLRRDKSGIYASLLKRKRNNRISGFLSGIATLLTGSRTRNAGLSVATASNIIILDSSTAQSLEQRIGGKLDDFRLRSRIFVHSEIVLLAVVDAAWNSVTIYHRGEPRPTNHDANNIKSFGKSQDTSNVMEQMMKAVSSGNLSTMNRF